MRVNDNAPFLRIRQWRREFVTGVHISTDVFFQQWQTRDRGSPEEWLTCTRRSYRICGRPPRAAATARCRLHDAPRASATSHQTWVHLPNMGLPQVHRDPCRRKGLPSRRQRRVQRVH